MILVDDHILAARYGEASDQGSSAIPLATTCCWWWRLVVAAGRLGQPTGAFDDLADSIVVPERSALLPTMARLALAYRLSVPAAEALAAAEVLGADIVVGQDTPRLREAARVRGITYLVEA